MNANAEVLPDSKASEDAAALVWCPYPDAQTARDAAAKMLEERLIVCANILPVIESIFEWEGRIDSATEVAALFKTNANQLDTLVTRLAQCHPYETPAVVGWRCDAAARSTMAWLNSTLG